MSLAGAFKRRVSHKQKVLNEEIKEEKEETELEYGQGYRDDDSDYMSNDFDVVDLKNPEGPMKLVHA